MFTALWSAEYARGENVAVVLAQHRRKPAMSEQPPICPGCGKPKEPYIHDPLRWWICSRWCSSAERRTAPTPTPPKGEDDAVQGSRNS